MQKRGSCSYYVVVRDVEDEQFRLMCKIFGGVSLGLLAGVGSVVVLHPWRRGALHAVNLAFALAIAAIVVAIWWAEAPHLLRWALPYVGFHMFVYMFGGAVGVMAGRPITRLAVRLLIPPRLRSPLAFLWLADGLPPPGAPARST